MKRIFGFLSLKILFL